MPPTLPAITIAINKIFNLASSTFIPLNQQIVSNKGLTKKIIACEECMDACIGNQSDVVIVNKGEPSHKVVDPIEQRVGLHLGLALFLGQLIEYDIISIIGQI